MREIKLLGVRLGVFETEEALEKIKEFLKEDGLRIVGMVTSAMLLASEESEEFRQQLEQLNLCVIREREVLEAAGITKAERLWEAEENWFCRIPGISGKIRKKSGPDCRDSRRKRTAFP